ncbi:hypothetical protein FB451DRAFT_1562424 [Mycena latifolia]|nr:hypothetical protein FB451DRAFT_1562424 [Mycena latifolia]
MARARSLCRNPSPIRDIKSSGASISRRGACGNCKRRKIRCDGAHPCNQCRLRPPRTYAPCTHSGPQEIQQTPGQMIETIHHLKERIEELELLLPPDPETIYLSQPYLTPVASGTPEPVLELEAPSIPEASHSFGLSEPSSDLIATLVDVFTDRFAGNTLFFLDPVTFRQSALLPLPFGDPNRPCPALLCAVYLWGSALAGIRPSTLYTPNTFLLCCLQNIVQDVHDNVDRPKFVLETIQAEVLLSLYYMHTAKPVPGRHHSSAAVSIAQGARLHLIGSGRYVDSHSLPFPLSTSAEWDSSEESMCIEALWAVVLLNNYWVAVDGAPSVISYEINIDTPWAASPHTLPGVTIMNLLNGDDPAVTSPAALLLKASILLQWVIAFGALNIGGPPDSSALARVETRLDKFRASLPPGPSSRALILAHALTDTAIIRLHATYVPIAASSRSKCLASAARITSSLGDSRSFQHPDPVLGAVYLSTYTFYAHEMETLCDRSSAGDLNVTLEYCALDVKAKDLIRKLGEVASSSPMIEHCVVQMQANHLAPLALNWPGITL